MIRSRLIAILAIVTAGTLVSASSCQTVVDTSCTAFVPITFSAKADSPETVEQIRGHNAAWDALCKK